HGFGGTNGFRGPHAVVVRTMPGDDVPVIGDPLTPFWVRAGWPTIFAAAAGIAGLGRMNAMFTRDLIPEYAVSIEPTGGHRRREFRAFIVKGGRIIRREVAVTSGGGINRPCTPPRFYPWTGHVGRSLVRIKGGNHDGQ